LLAPLAKLPPHFQNRGAAPVYTNIQCYYITHLLAAVTYNKEPLFRLRRAVVTHERHTSALRVSVGDTGRQVLRSCRATLLGQRHQCSGKRRHQRRADVVQSEREVTLSAQSQVSATVSTVSRRTRQQWTATCPQYHRRPTRFVDNNH